MLRQKIQDDIKNAMRNKVSLELETLRMLLAEIKKADITKRVDAEKDRETALLNDVEILGIINRMIKQRLDSAAHFKQADRQELASKEEAEIIILQNYLPKQLTDTETEELVTAAIAKTNAQSIKDMGKVMALVKEQSQGRVDMSKVSSLVKKQLAELS